MSGSVCKVVALGALALVSAPAAPRFDRGGGPPWRGEHARLLALRDHFAADLERARRELVARAGDDAELLRRLRGEPIEPREPGYGVLPEITSDDSPGSVVPVEQRYELGQLGASFAEDVEAAARLAARAPRREEELEPLVAELERVRERLSLFEDHLGYHAYWQTAVVDYPDYFAARNRLVSLVHRLERLLSEDGADPATAAALRREITDRLAPFAPTPGLAVESRAGGRRVLPLTVTTDIEDEAFLETVRRAVESVFAAPGTAGRGRLELELRWRRVPAAELYAPGTPPRPGQRIDAEAHLARFPAGALVLTTGEESTHAWTGRAVVLGPQPISRRTLAHEFGHLLGFGDAYLRGFEGDPDGPFGVVLVEWTGLGDDLMGDGRSGRVSEEMIDTLLAAYADGPR